MQACQTKKRWSELSEGARRLVVLGAVFEGVLKIMALIDLKRRPASEIRGSKAIGDHVSACQLGRGGPYRLLCLWAASAGPQALGETASEPSLVRSTQIGVLQPGGRLGFADCAENMIGVLCGHPQTGPTAEQPRSVVARRRPGWSAAAPAPPVAGPPSADGAIMRQGLDTAASSDGRIRATEERDGADAVRSALPSPPARCGGEGRTRCLRDRRRPPRSRPDPDRCRPAGRRRPRAIRL